MGEAAWNVRGCKTREVAEPATVRLKPVYRENHKNEAAQKLPQFINIKYLVGIGVSNISKEIGKTNTALLDTKKNIYTVNNRVFCVTPVYKERSKWTIFDRFARLIKAK